MKAGSCEGRSVRADGAMRIGRKQTQSQQEHCRTTRCTCLPPASAPAARRLPSAGGPSGAGTGRPPGAPAVLLAATPVFLVRYPVAQPCALRIAAALHHHTVAMPAQTWQAAQPAGARGQERGAGRRQRGRAAAHGRGTVQAEATRLYSAGLGGRAPDVRVCHRVRRDHTV